jgi:hypothetical protein
VAALTSQDRGPETSVLEPAASAGGCTDLSGINEAARVPPAASNTAAPVCGPGVAATAAATAAAAAKATIVASSAAGRLVRGAMQRLRDRAAPSPDQRGATSAPSSRPASPRPAGVVHGGLPAPSPAGKTFAGGRVVAAVADIQGFSAGAAVAELGADRQDTRQCQERGAAAHPLAPQGEWRVGGAAPTAAPLQPGTAEDPTWRCSTGGPAELAPGSEPAQSRGLGACGPARMEGGTNAPAVSGLEEGSDAGVVGCSIGVGGRVAPGSHRIGGSFEWSRAVADGGYGSVASSGTEDDEGCSSGVDRAAGARPGRIAQWLTRLEKGSDGVGGRCGPGESGDALCG